MVECQLPKLKVAGSSPVSRSNLKFRKPWHCQGFFDGKPGKRLLYGGLNAAIKEDMRTSSDYHAK
jgi:hypothetical protein